MQPSFDIVFPGRKSKDPAVTQLPVVPGLYLLQCVCDVGRKACIVNLEILLEAIPFARIYTRSAFSWCNLKSLPIRRFLLRFLGDFY